MTDVAQTTWRNAIVRTAHVPPGDLTADPLNWRLHPAFQQQALTALVDVEQLTTLYLDTKPPQLDTLLAMLHQPMVF